MSPGPTAKARPSPSCAPRSKRAATRSTPSPARTSSASTSASASPASLIDDETLAAAAHRSARRRRRHRAELLRGRDGGCASSPSRERRPTPASSRSGSAAGWMRPTSSSARWSRGSPTSRSTTSSSSAHGLTDIAGEKAGDRQARRAARHAALPAGGRQPRSARSRTSGARRGCRAAACWDAIVRQGSFAIATSTASSTCRCRGCPGGIRR